MEYRFFATFHLIAACTALVAGLGVSITRKGTRFHKQLGYAYVFNMLGLNLSALFIYRLTGHFGPFHGAALMSVLTLIAGFLPVFLRLPNGRWLELHYELMNWSYVGLVAAGVSEATTRIPAAPFWPAVFAGTLAVFVVGSILIARGRSKYRFEALARHSHAALDIGEALKRKRAACN